MKLRFPILDFGFLPGIRGPRKRATPRNPKLKTQSPKPAQRASVLVIVMITLIVTSLALVAFIEKASNDLLVDLRAAEAKRLRAEAYSALETTLAVLEDFRGVGNGLHSPAEGWADPLGFAAWTPTEGRTVEVAFEDESGKLSLPHADVVTLTNLFKAWEMPASDAERLADALMGWMKAGYVYTTAISPDYERGAIPYEPPGRSLRSFDELPAIEVVRDLLFDEKDHRPNQLWYRFTDEVSLFNFRQPNLNSAKPDILTALGQFDPSQQQKVGEYLTGTGSYSTQGPAWFADAATARTVVGQSGNPGGFGTTISALRISITVHEGQSQFRLSAVVAPQGGATTVQTTATSTRNQTSASATQPASAQPHPSATATPAASPSTATPAKKLNYPFTLLEIRENDEIPQPPPPPPAAPI